MNTIGESVNPWRPSVELAVLPANGPAEGAPVAIGSGNDTGETGRFKIFGDDGFTFLDFLDIINPLQNISIVATLYRQMTGDSIDPGSRVIGDTLLWEPSSPWPMSWSTTPPARTWASTSWLFRR